jgi:hypothetical protein
MAVGIATVILDTGLAGAVPPGVLHPLLATDGPSSMRNRTPKLHWVHQHVPAFAPANCNVGATEQAVEDTHKTVGELLAQTPGLFGGTTATLHSTLHWVRVRSDPRVKLATSRSYAPSGKQRRVADGAEEEDDQRIWNVHSWRTWRGSSQCWSTASAVATWRRWVDRAICVKLKLSIFFLIGFGI